ncbi:MAG: hypothetical protein CSA09_02090 [Candidatus Contendobacter odensis]|uniref:DUF6795 domain-containing protein n=1 Tax=Candidatus Contendibacter odensensis TaxID=1400860 RepID=A0A2G6PFE9_9GAMM|nr:MAG: hypothetical protein CSA09_02090 [Candidatus Contendobacter odensis]
MAFSQLCVFSEVKGIVLQNGVPIANATIEQRYFLGDKPYSNTTASDSQGQFKFPVAYSSSFFRSIMPHEPIVRQKIFIQHNGESYEAWNYTKRNYRVNGERDGRALIMKCDLNTEPTAKEAYKNAMGQSINYYGICELVDHF